MSVCVKCGRSDAGSMRHYKGKWYCNNSRTDTNHNKCWSETYEEKATGIVHIKVEVICPFCDTDISDKWNDPDIDYNVCPGCGAEFGEGYEETVHFIKETPK